MALATNAVVAFLIAFYWQGTVILTLLKEMVSADGPNPWRAYDLGSGVNMFNRFVAGEILPELRKKWLKAIKYVVLSYVTLFLVAGLLKFFVPELLR